MVVLLGVVAGEGLGGVAALAGAGEGLDHCDVEHLPGVIGAFVHHDAVVGAGGVAVGERGGGRVGLGMISVSSLVVVVAGRGVPAEVGELLEARGGGDQVVDLLRGSARPAVRPG